MQFIPQGCWGNTQPDPPESQSLIPSSKAHFWLVQVEQVSLGMAEYLAKLTSIAWLDDLPSQSSQAFEL